MDYAQLLALRQRHPAWRLLRADHAPLIASFLQQAFVAPNRRSLDARSLASLLEDRLYSLNQEADEPLFPRSASAYLDEWADNANGWLRKFYPPGNDEAHFELTPASEKAIEWLASLGKRQFVGTESRLLSIFELLRQMVQGSETDPQARILELEKRKAALDEEIARIRAGEVALMDDTRVRERFLKSTPARAACWPIFASGTELPRPRSPVRERIATWGGGGRVARGDFRRARRHFRFRPGPQLPRLLGVPDVAGAPGRTVRAAAQGLRARAGTKPGAGPAPLRVHYDWLEAGEMAQRTVARLSEQLRRYRTTRPGWRIGESCTCCAISKPGPGRTRAAAERRTARHRCARARTDPATRPATIARPCGRRSKP